MNPEFLKQTATLHVSRFDENGWWLGNQYEHVAKGTALGKEFTENVYEPSAKGMIGQYDEENDAWKEIKNNALTEFWNAHGDGFIVGVPDGDIPEWGITEKPPEHDHQFQTVLYSEDSGWKISEVLIGKSYYDSEGHELLVADYNFELPDKHSWDKPPKAQEGHAVRLVNNLWEQLVDHREKTAFPKDRDNVELVDYQVGELGELPDTHTLDKPELYDTWSNELGWQYDIERHRPFKDDEERKWRNNELDKVINRIDQYEKDKNYPIELRTSSIQSEADFLLLLQDRKALSDYPDKENFPFCERPTLSGLAD